MTQMRGMEQAMVAAIDYVLRSHDASWDYARWAQLPSDGYRYEVVAGVLYALAVPRVEHAFCVSRLLRAVAVLVEDRGLGQVVLGPVGVVIHDVVVVQPDFAVLRAGRVPEIIVDGYIHGVPDLIAEVLSSCDTAHDTIIKRAAYARAGVPEYWIVRPASRDVLVCSQPDAELSDFTEVRHFAADDEFVGATLPIRLPVAALFQDIPAQL